MHNKHYTLLLLAAILFLSTANAQPILKDQKTIGGGLEDEFTCMYLTKDGGLIVGGWSQSDSGFQKSQNKRGSHDYWIIKYDSSHNKQWDKTIGGSAGDDLHALQQTSDGGYILGGFSYSDSSGEKTGNNKGGGDMWVVKLDGSGNVQWDKTIGSSSTDDLVALQQTKDGGYILGGTSDGDKSGDKSQNNVGGSSDYWVVKLDANGNKLWDKTIGGFNSDDLGDIKQTKYGGYIIGGTSFSGQGGDKTETSRRLADYWIVKLKANGNIEWDKTIGGSKYDYFGAIQQTTDGGYMIGGYSESPISGEKTAFSKGGFDYWLIKLDKDHNIQWDKTIGGNSADYLYAIQQTKDSGYIMSGESFSNISGDKTENNKRSIDYWVVKANSNGGVEWDKTIGGNGSDRYAKILEIKNNSYVIGGSSSSGVSGDKTNPVRDGGGIFMGDYIDYWIVGLRYLQPDSVAVTQVQSGRLAAPQPNSTIAFSIYPNPATTVLHIQNNGKATFVLTDLSGKTVLTKAIEGNADVNVANIPTGTYYLTNTATRATQKVVITK